MVEPPRPSLISQCFSEGPWSVEYQSPRASERLCDSTGVSVQFISPLSVFGRGRSETDRLTDAGVKNGSFSHQRNLNTCFHHRYRREVFSWPLASRRSRQSGVEDILNLSYALGPWSRRSLPGADGDSEPLN